MNLVWDPESSGILKRRGATINPAESNFVVEIYLYLSLILLSRFTFYLSLSLAIPPLNIFIVDKVFCETGEFKNCHLSDCPEAEPDTHSKLVNKALDINVIVVFGYWLVQYFISILIPANMISVGKLLSLILKNLL